MAAMRMHEENHFQSQFLEKAIVSGAGRKVEVISD